MVGALYYVFGPNWLVVKLVGAVLSGLAVLPAESVGRQLGGERLARRAAWLVAIYPSGVFWGATGLKDGPLATLFLAVAALGLKPLAPGRLAVQVGLCAVAFAARPVLGVICILTLVVPVVRAMRPTRRAPRGESRRPFALVGLALLAYLVLPTVIRDVSLLGRVSAIEGSSALPGSLFLGSRLAVSAPIVALLGPFPWAFDQQSRTVYQGLYPGMLIWILLLPGAALGLWEVLRRGNAAARGIVVAALILLIMYLAYFGDEGFFRQRFVLEPFLLILALLAFQIRTDWAVISTAAWAVFLGPATLVQTGVWPPAGAAVVIGVALVVFAVIRRLRRQTIHAA